MTTVRYDFKCGDTGAMQAEFRSIAAEARHPILGVCSHAIVARERPLLRRAWIWCKYRPWLMFIIGVMIGQAFVAAMRML